MAVDKVIIEYQLKTDQLRKELDEVKAQIGTVQDTATKSATSLTTTFARLGGAIAAAFSIREVIQFASEAEKLARTAEGVKIAFDKLNDPLLLTRLREATKGTVNDLVLMQTAVKASNFKLPLDQLSKLLGFAAQRARETGESVDYLVESIVLGISRKSIPILDNLGISAVQIQEEFKKTGDFAVAVGNIIDQEMSKGASATAEQAEAADRAKAEFENLKIQIGQGLLPVFTNMRIAFNEFLKTIDFSLKGVKEYREQLRLLGLTELQQQEIMAIQEFANVHQKSYGTALEAATAYLTQTKAGYDELKKSIEENGLSEARRNSRSIYQERIKTIENYIKTLQATETEEENLNTTLETSNQIIDRLYPPTTALTKALMEMGQAFAYVRTENTQGIETFFDVERAAIALLDDASGFPALKQSIVEYVDTMALARAENRDFFDSLTLGLSAAEVLFGTYGQLLTDTANKQSAVADFGRQLAFFEIASAQAVAVANAVKLVSASAKTPVDYFIFLATLLSSIGASIGKAKGLIEGANAPKFAKGVVDLQGEGTETSDSIWARLSKGESVITAKGTKQDKGLFKAANKMQLQEYINQNYVLPMMLRKEGEKQSAFDDYRLYLAMMNNQKAVKEGSRQVVDAIKRRSRRYDWN